MRDLSPIPDSLRFPQNQASDVTTPNGPDVFGAFTRLGTDHNLIGIGHGTETGFVNGTNSDQIGTTPHPIDPKLGLLANNGGPTETMALPAGSPALGNGAPGATSKDQRGVARDATTPDIGALEAPG